MQVHKRRVELLQNHDRGQGSQTTLGEHQLLVSYRLQGDANGLQVAPIKDEPRKVSNGVLIGAWVVVASRKVEQGPDALPAPATVCPIARDPRHRMSKRRDVDEWQPEEDGAGQAHMLVCQEGHTAPSTLQ